MDKHTQEKLLKQVKRNYEEIAEEFNEKRKKFIWPSIIKLTTDVKNGDRVLDVGCGNGRLLEAFKNKNIEYLGVDSSEELINMAKGNYPGYKFIIGDIFKLDQIPETDFNFVYCIAVLHHIPGRDLRVKALQQLKDKGAHESYLIVTVWNMWSHKRFLKLIFKYTILKLIGKNKMDFGDILFDWKNSQREKVSQRYYHSFRKSEFKKIISKAGLKIVKLYKDKYNYYAVLKK